MSDVGAFVDNLSRKIGHIGHCGTVAELDKQFVFSHTGHSVLVSTRGVAFHILRHYLKSCPNYSSEIESVDPAGLISWVDVPVDVGTAVYNYMLAQIELITPPAPPMAGAPENRE